MAGDHPISPGGKLIIIVASVMAPFVIVAVGLRLWARKLKRTPLTASDYLVVASLIVILAYIGIGYAMAIGGVLGYSIFNVNPQDYVVYAKASPLDIASDITWVFATCFMKCSALVFYMEIFQHQRVFLICCYMLMTVIALYNIATVVLSFVLCNPVNKIWDPAVPGTCLDTKLIFLGIGSVNIPIDFLVVLFPMPILWKLQMPISKKVIVSVITSLGLLASVFSILRIDASFRVSTTAFELNYSEACVYAVTWGGLEVYVGLITACLPLMQPVIAHVFGRESKLRTWLKLSSGSSGGPSSGGASGNKRSKLSLPSFQRRGTAQGVASNRSGDEQLRRLHKEGTEMDSRNASKAGDEESCCVGERVDDLPHKTGL